MSVVPPETRHEADSSGSVAAKTTGQLHTEWRRTMAHGSNVFDVLAVLELASIVAPERVGVAPAALTLDIPIMIAVASAYTVYLVLDATGHVAFAPVSALAWFVLSLTGLTLPVVGWRASWRRVCRASV